MLKTSAITGKRGEPEHFGSCAFTKAETFKSELVVSEISGKPYRADQQARSAVSGKAGHTSEFIACHETRQTLARGEALACEVSGHLVRPDVLVACEVTGTRVLPSFLARCEATGKRVLRSRLVTSSVSNTLLQREAGVQSAAGNFCLPSEAQACVWSGRRAHLDDLRVCALTGLPIHTEYTTPQPPPRLRPLVELLDGMRRNADADQIWEKVAQRLKHALRGGKCRVEAAILSPSKQHLAICAESRSMLGFRVHQVGAMYDLADDAIVGRLAEGKRNAQGWTAR